VAKSGAAESVTYPGMPQHTSPLGTQNVYAIDLRSQQGPQTPLHAAQRIEALPSRDAHAADQLASTMKLVKSARFNAAERLERKQKVSLATQSIVALYFIGVAVFQAVYIGQIDDATNRLLTFIQIVSSVFTLILGLLESLNDYQMKAHHLSNCALAVADLSQDLRIANITDKSGVQDYRRRYNEALRACPVNHTRLDYQFALLDGKGDSRAWAAVYARYMMDVYGLYALFLSVPPLLWWLHR
jgi:SMODS and SLOG-associating 2TM effector domain family 5